MPKVGLEPTPTCVDRILSPARLPFRHFGELISVYVNSRGRQPFCGADRLQDGSVNSLTLLEGQQLQFLFGKGHERHVHFAA